MSKLLDVGLDVHKDTIVIAVTEEGQVAGEDGSAGCAAVGGLSAAAAQHQELQRKHHSEKSPAQNT